jgi:hypothetical protein
MLHEKHLFNLFFITSSDILFISGRIWAVVVIQ